MQGARCGMHGARWEMGGARCMEHGASCKVQDARCKVRGGGWEVQGVNCNNVRCEVRDAKVRWCDATRCKVHGTWLQGLGCEW